MNELILYHYWRSSASWRVRWALKHKNVSVQYKAVDLLHNEQNSQAHLKRNTMGSVPVLEIHDGQNVISIQNP